MNKCPSSTLHCIIHISSFSPLLEKGWTGGWHNGWSVPKVKSSSCAMRFMGVYSCTPTSLGCSRGFVYEYRRYSTGATSEPTNQGCLSEFPSELSTSQLLVQRSRSDRSKHASDFCQCYFLIWNSAIQGTKARNGSENSWNSVNFHISCN